MRCEISIELCSQEVAIHQYRLFPWKLQRYRFAAPSRKMYFETRFCIAPDRRAVVDDENGPLHRFG